MGIKKGHGATILLEPVPSTTRAKGLEIGMGKCSNEKGSKGGCGA